jgi:transcriptional regulator with XRE-family HTH domain
MYYDILPETLLTLRDRQGWSQAKLAAEAGVHRKTIIEKEKSGCNTRTRDFLAKRIAQALGVGVHELGKTIPEETFRLDIDVFCQLRRMLSKGDNYHSIRTLKYIAYHLAEALEIAQLDLGPNWNVKALEGPRPTLPTVPAGPIEISYGQIDRDILSELMGAWRATFDGSLVNPSKILRDPKFARLQAVIGRLPVTENGKINIFWLKAYLRRVSDQVIDGYSFCRFSTFQEELWCVCLVERL